MKESIVIVEGMSCEHCVKAVTKAINALPGIGNVAVDLKKGLVTVKHDIETTGIEKLKKAIIDQGYDIKS